MPTTIGNMLNCSSKYCPLCRTKAKAKVELLLATPVAAHYYLEVRSAALGKNAASSSSLLFVIARHGHGIISICDCHCPAAAAAAAARYDYDLLRRPQLSFSWCRGVEGRHSLPSSNHVMDRRIGKKLFHSSARRKSMLHRRHRRHPLQYRRATMVMDRRMG